MFVARQASSSFVRVSGSIAGPTTSGVCVRALCAAAAGGSGGGGGANAHSRPITPAWSSTSSTVPSPVTAARPTGVGIVKADLYFPSTYVAQHDLELFDGVGAGKYTKGLGLQKMAFCDDNEDINSVFLTAVHQFLETHNLSPRDIGRLEVGTETLVDKSKAAKTTLMQLFAQSGNTNIEGIDNINACYGGTAALLNTAAWVESSAWDGRYGLVVCGDIATYEPGPARPTGGAAVAVMLVGPKAPLVMEPGLRHSYFEHAYDFYKPRMDSEWPVVDGHLSISCYLRALDKCYAGWVAKAERAAQGKQFNLSTDVDYCLFHAPFTKMTNKAFARLLFNDARRHPERFAANLQALAAMPIEQSYASKDIEKEFSALGADLYKQKVAATTLFSANTGNSYTSSLYTALVGTLMHDASPDRRFMMFSYGSGLAATLFSIRTGAGADKVIDREAIQRRLDSRIKVSPEDFTIALARRQMVDANWKPSATTDKLFPGTYHLTHIDAQYRRFYARK